MLYSDKYGTDRIRVLTLVENRGKGGAIRMVSILNYSISNYSNSNIRSSVVVESPFLLMGNGEFILFFCLFYMHPDSFELVNWGTWHRC